MASTWTPQPDGLNELVELFRQSTSTERDVQRRIAQVRWWWTAAY